MLTGWTFYLIVIGSKLHKGMSYDSQERLAVWRELQSVFGERRSLEDWKVAFPQYDIGE